MNTFAVPYRQGSRPKPCVWKRLSLVSGQMVIFMASVQTLGPNEWLRSERERMGIKKNGLVPKHQTIINHFKKKLVLELFSYYSSARALIELQI